MAEDRIRDKYEAGQLMSEILLGRLTTGITDPGKMARLEEWITEHPEDREEFERLSDPAQLKLSLEAYDRAIEMTKKDYQAFLERTQPYIQKRAGHRILAISAIAASLLIAAGVTWLLRYQPHKAQPSGLAVKMYDIAPGGNKAILTLADGKKIALDSTSTGLIAQQGNTHVLQTGQGQIDYQAEKSKNVAAAFNTMTTPRGGTFQLTLSDGTRVWLNAGTTLTYPVSFAGLKQREVNLIGEAYFEVAKNSTSPFQIKTGDASIKVLGTHFNVMAYPDEKQMETTLLEGSVKVFQGTMERIIKPGQQARVDNSGSISVTDVDPDDYVAWKSGLIQLHHADIPAVMRQIDRWYDVQVEYKGSEMPSFTLAGTVPRTLSLLEALKVLQLNGINCRLLDGRKIEVLLNK